MSGPFVVQEFGLDGLLSVPEAAELLRVSQACIRAWLSRGRLPRIKAGRRTLISRASLAALLQITQPVHSALGDELVTTDSTEDGLTIPMAPRDRTVVRRGVQPLLGPRVTPRPW